MAFSTSRILENTSYSRKLQFIESDTMVKTSKVIGNVQPEIEKLHQKAISKVGGIYVRLFLKDPEFPLQNPKRVVPLLMKAIGWQGGSIPALETLKRVVVAGIRAKGLLKVGVVEVLIGLLDWRGGLYLQMNWNEQPSKLEANGKPFKSSKTSSE
ncbi:hypothetical protein OROMI_004984 [Orobanche minor]